MGVVATSDALLNAGGGILRGRAEIVHDRVRRLFADNPEAVVADTPVLREPLCGVPVQLVHGLDVCGDLVSWLESELMPLATLGRRLGRGGWRGWPSDGASNALAAHLLDAKLTPRDVRTEPQEMQERQALRPARGGGALWAIFEAARPQHTCAEICSTISSTGATASRGWTRAV